MSTENEMRTAFGEEPHTGTFADDEPPTFREVMAYVDGVAAALSATRKGARPVGVTPCPEANAPSAPCGPAGELPRPSGTERRCDGAHAAELATASTASADARGRATVRYGEVGIARGYISVVPAPVPPSVPYTTARGGARLLDFGAGDVGVTWEAGVPLRDTLPYGAVTVSLAPANGPVALGVPSRVEPAIPVIELDRTLDEESVRTSDVYLRCARLSPEWYDLTGTDDR